MVISRKNIISKAESAKTTKDANETKPVNQSGEDVWFSKDALYKDHLNEVLQKWKQIDDNIWGKLIIFERNQRVAKAYLRTNRVNINSSTIGFDGSKIGLNGFHGCFHDEKVNMVKSRIGKGVDLSIEENGNISVRKVNGKCEIFVRPYDTKSNALPDRLMQSDGRVMGADLNAPSIIFDLHKFKCNIFKELNGDKADRKRLENQCICSMIFIRESTTNDSGLYNPVWLLLINIVALDFLRSKYFDLLLNVDIPVPLMNRQKLDDKNYARKERFKKELLIREQVNGELVNRESTNKELSKEPIDNESIKRSHQNEHLNNSPITQNSKSQHQIAQQSKLTSSPVEKAKNNLNKHSNANKNWSRDMHKEKCDSAKKSLKNSTSMASPALPPRPECATKQSSYVNSIVNVKQANVIQAHAKQVSEQNDLQSNKCSKKSSSNLKSDCKPAHKAISSVSNLMAMFNKSISESTKAQDKNSQPKNDKPSIKSTSSDKYLKEVKSEQMVDKDESPKKKKPSKEADEQSDTKEVSKMEANNQIKKPTVELTKQLSSENVNEEDEVMICNKTKLIEKKLIDEMQNGSSREQSTPSNNQCKLPTHVKLNPYKNGYISAYFENNRQKSFNRALYTQNSFDSGFYSPSSNDSYNLSSTSGSCNVIYSTSGSEQNTLNTNEDLNKKDYPTPKEASMFLDSIDLPPTNFKISENKPPRNAACFNGPGFTYWSKYRNKYYSSEILSDWN